MGYGWGSNRTIDRNHERILKWEKRKPILDALIAKHNGVFNYAKYFGIPAGDVYAMSRGDRPISDRAIEISNDKLTE